MTRKCQIWFPLLLLCCGSAQAEDNFPLPPELRPDVDFWISIFTQYTTDQGVMHDAGDLRIVYTSIDFPKDTGPRARQRVIVEQRKAIQSVLSSLATGKRDKLTAEEARILALFPSAVDNKTLVDASRNIRYQQGLRDRFRGGLVRAGQWRDFIGREFAALGVPADLAALPHVESSYNPEARSSVGASGIWQFTRSTGRRFLRVDHIVDERNDPFTATRGAGKLLAYNYSIVGNWPMAITAYNHGLAGVRRAMQQFGDTAYVDILRNYKGRTFGFASRNFYVAFLAAREVDQNVDKYFPGLQPEPPTEYVSVALPGFISVRDLSVALGVTPQQLAAHNPALQPTVWQGSKHVPRDFEVRMPASLIKGPMATLVAGIEPDRWQSAQLPDLFHTVQRGDTLSQIAQTYKTQVSTLVALNNLSSSHRIRAGQQLRLPAAGPAPAIVSEPEQVQPEPVAVAALPPAEAAAGETMAEAVAGEAPVETASAGEFASALLGTIQTALLSDPSDYSIAADNTIEIYPLETLGHFADWLEIRTQRLRDINGLAFRTPVEVGKRLRLDLSKVDAKTFEDRRIEWHREQQDSYFRGHVITGMQEHVILPGESIWVLALREYDVPMWLVSQYNPGVDLQSVTPGMTLRFPVLQSVETS